MSMMKKTLLWSIAVLSMLALTGCGSSNDKEATNSSEKIEQSSKEKTDTSKLMDEAKAVIKDKKFYVAKEKLEAIKKEDSKDEQAIAMLNQVNHYQQAKDKLNDKKYKEAENSNSSSSNSSESTKEWYTAKNLSNYDKTEINKKMTDWCESQARKGGMTTLNGVHFMSGGWWTKDTKCYIQTPDGQVLVTDMSLLSDGPKEDNMSNQPNAYLPKAGNINSLGGAMFFVSGSFGVDTSEEEKYKYAVGSGIEGDGVAEPGTNVDYYVWADNGKVYELKRKVTGNGEGRRGYNISITNGGAKDNNKSPEYIVSKDQAAINKYQSLLKEYGGDSNGESHAKAKSASQSLWNSEKASELSSFMSSWASEMDQEYQQADLNSENNTVMTKNTLSLVTSDKYQPARGIAIFEVNGKEQPISVSRDGEGSGIQIVDCYSRLPGEGDSAPYVYLFVLNNGKPEVLFCDITKDIDSSSGKAYANFKPTQNQALQKGFKDIVNG